MDIPLIGDTFMWLAIGTLLRGLELIDSLFLLIGKPNSLI
jgi:hypothetical protein